MQRGHSAGKMSPLTLGSGKVTRYDNIDRLELHLNTNDYSSLITQRLRPTDNFSVIRETQTCDTPKHTKLPKTFVTKTGSLFIYSDSKIMKDTEDHFPESVTRATPDPFCVQGSKVTSLLNPDNASTWRKYVSPRKNNINTQTRALGSEEKRNKQKYILGLNESAGNRPKSNRKPYSWNYAIAPVKVTDTKQRVSLETVKGLSEALLSYRIKQISDRTRYENTVINSLGGSLDRIGKLSNNKGIPKRRISAWTFEWVKSARSDRRVTETAEDDVKVRPKTTYQLLQKARADLLLANRIRAPTNTPLTANDRNGLDTPERSTKLSSSPILMPSNKQTIITETSEFSGCLSDSGTTSTGPEVI